MLAEKLRNVNNLKQADNTLLDDQALGILDDQDLRIMDDHVLGILDDPFLEMLDYQVIDVLQGDDDENNNINDKNDLDCKPNERKRKQSTNGIF